MTSTQRPHLFSPVELEAFREGLPLSVYDRGTFYTFDGHGYRDYPVYDAVLST
jgi:hypothetical protein